MNGAQDLGGQMGFGAIAPEADEPLFHADWEKRAMGVTIACGAFGAWTLDESRHARESLPPAAYYNSSYYEVWARALTDLLLRHGFVTEAELEAGHEMVPGATPKAVLKAIDVPAMLARGGPVERTPDREPSFAVGDTVRTAVIHPRGHTRLPRYARGKTGRIEAVRGFHVFPDTNADGRGEHPQWLYTIAFKGSELWGREGDPGLVVSIDAWESYLERA